jgi:hypothetical protein
MILKRISSRPIFRLGNNQIIPVITQPPFSLDLAPSDLWLFPALKMGLKGAHFTAMEDIKLNVTAERWKIPKEAFCWFSQQWQDQRSKFVYARVLL